MTWGYFHDEEESPAFMVLISLFWNCSCKALFPASLPTPFSQPWKIPWTASPSKGPQHRGTANLRLSKLQFCWAHKIPKIHLKIRQSQKWNTCKSHDKNLINFPRERQPGSKQAPPAHRLSPRPCLLWWCPYTGLHGKSTNSPDSPEEKRERKNQRGDRDWEGGRGWGEGRDTKREKEGGE